MLLLAFLTLGTKATQKGVTLSGSPVPLVLAAILAVGIALASVYFLAPEWIEHYTREHVFKRAAQTGSAVGMGAFLASLILLRLFGAPFYACPPVDRLYQLIRGMLAAPQPSPTMPDMRWLYDWLHIIIVGAILTAVVMALSGSACSALARQLRAGKPVVQKR